MGDVKRESVEFSEKSRSVPRAYTPCRQPDVDFSDEESSEKSKDMPEPDREWRTLIMGW